MRLGGHATVIARLSAQNPLKLLISSNCRGIRNPCWHVDPIRKRVSSRCCNHHPEQRVRRSQSLETHAEPQTPRAEPFFENSEAIGDCGSGASAAFGCCSGGLFEHARWSKDPHQPRYSMSS